MQSGRAGDVPVTVDVASSTFASAIMHPTEVRSSIGPYPQPPSDLLMLMCNAGQLWPHRLCGQFQHPDWLIRFLQIVAIRIHPRTSSCWLRSTSTVAVTWARHCWLHCLCWQYLSCHASHLTVSATWASPCQLCHYTSSAASAMLATTDSTTLAISATQLSLLHLPAGPYRARSPGLAGIPVLDWCLLLDLRTTIPYWL